MTSAGPRAAAPRSTRAGRRLVFGLQTLLGIRQRGFFIPYRHADALAELATYPALLTTFASAEPRFAALIAAMDRHAPALASFGAEPPPEPRWTQDWFPRLDGAAAYVIVRERRPKRIVEIGSGHSTRFLARAVRDGNLATEIVAIDPEPRADIAGLPLRQIRSTLQAALSAGGGGKLFGALAAGDILFVDSSHILMPGSDVDLILNGLLPALPAGVLIHVHDVFLPDAYPRDWAWRGYNEQLGVAALLTGAGFRIVWGSRYVATRMAATVSASVAGRLPLPDGAYEASLWLEKR